MKRKATPDPTEWRVRMHTNDLEHRCQRCKSPTHGVIFWTRSGMICSRCEGKERKERRARKRRR